MKKLLLAKWLFTAVISLLVIYGCSASTSTRYSKDENTNTESTKTEDKEISTTTKLDEDFDITPYKTEIVVPEKNTENENVNQNVWFDYGSSEIETQNKILTGTGNGYRVLVLTTDNLEEANQVKTDVYFGQNNNEVYIDFEPPFYKVKVGDFDNQKNAEDLRFKLNQLGFKEAKVINDKINIYK